MFEGMDELSRAFGEALFEVFPEWEQFAKSDGGGFEVSVPRECDDRVLRLVTSEEDITFEFDEWHFHVGPFIPFIGTVAAAVDDAMAMVIGFANEVMYVDVTYRDGKWLQSSLGYVEAIQPPSPGTITRRYSWKGTFDEVIDTRRQKS